MVADSAPGSSIQELLAANLRRLRIARHLSLSELARATTMSKATLSGIESGKANPTVETLAALAGALRVSVIELLEELPLGEVRVSRAADAVFSAGDGFGRRALDIIDTAGELEVSEIALQARHLQEVEAMAPGTRGSVFVLSGTLITGPVERSSELGPGDYITFPADVPHVYETGRRPARALVLTRTGG